MDKKLLISEINKLKKEKKAVIMAHYYVDSDIQDIADFIGDSLALSQLAEKTDAEIIVMCGVHFMAETAKVLSPEKKVICPDFSAGCSLADSCEASALEKFKLQYPGYKVISYVNTTAKTKALTDIVVTSSNACQIVDSLPKDEKIIFGPDKNLGSYINKQTGRNMVLWSGCCHVHNRFSADKLKTLKSIYPEALVLAHPECNEDILSLSDKIGATSYILKQAKILDNNLFIIATEPGILHQLRKECPNKIFIPLPSADSNSSLNECEYMKLITLDKVYNSLLTESPLVELDVQLIEESKRSIKKMLEISAELGL